MRWLSVLFFLFAFCAAGQSLADETIRYAPPSAWVERAPIEDSSRTGGALQIILLDDQKRFSAGGEESYIETVIKILNAQGLQSARTLAASWDPVLQDITINIAEIRRGDQVIDLLAGRDFRTLQRETGLGSAILDGRLTAIKEINDLRVGDTLVFAVSLRTRDPIANAAAEDWMTLSHTGTADRVRYRAVWPASMPVEWKTTAGIEGARVVERGAERELIYDARDVITPRPPTGAPDRFNTLGEIELSGYGEWTTLSSLFAPIFRQASTLAGDSPLHAEIAKIRAANATEEGRALAALRLVEDEVRYLAMVMGDGGVTPTPADQTWAQRYGDCKAKTALLVALLTELGVKAEPVLVRTAGGEALSGSLPRIGAFDHVIVRAEIAGKVYWLDATRTGDLALSNIDPPPFAYGLPLQEGGADLIEIEMPPGDLPRREVISFVDASNGLDVDGPVEIKEIYRGDEAVAMQAMVEGVSPDLAEEGLREFGMGYSWLESIDTVAYGFNPVTEAFEVTYTGTGNLGWDLRAGSGRAMIETGYNYGFQDRRANEDQAAPFAIAYPYYSVRKTEVRLPAGRNVRLSETDVDENFDFVHVTRMGRIENGVANIEMRVRALIPEIGAEESKIQLERIADTSLSRPLYISTATSTASNDAQTRELDAIEEAIDSGRLEVARSRLEQFMAENPENLSAFFVGMRIAEAEDDLDGALEYADLGLSVSPTNPLLAISKYSLLMEMGRYADALESVAIMEGASGLGDGVNDYRAAPLIGLRRYDEAIDVLDRYYEDSDDGGQGVAVESLRAVVLTLREAERQTLIQTLDRRPTSVMARFLKAIAQQRQDPRLTVAQYDQIIAMAPDFARARWERVNANVLLQNYDAALVDLDWLVAWDDEDVAYLMRRSHVREYKGDYAAAIADLSLALDIEPEDGVLLNARCWLRATRNIETEQALEDCNRALALEPTVAAYYDSRGLANIRLNQPARAVADYDTALALEPVAESYFGRGIAKRMLDDPAGSRADIAEAIKLDPSVDELFADYGITP